MRIGVVVALVFAVAGCGSSPSSYSLDASQECLSGLGETTPQADLDYVAQDVAGGAVGVDVSGDQVAVMFHNSVNDAKRTAGALKLLGAGLDVPVDDIVEQRTNVVIEWDNTPTDSQASSVRDCLA